MRFRHLPTIIAVIIALISHSSEGGPAAHYRYTFKGKQFGKLKFISSGEDIKAGDSFIVKFNSKYPGTSYILVESPIKGKVLIADCAWGSIEDLKRAIRK
jgi:hypothetical protein